jgi:hypothetical protein
VDYAPPSLSTPYRVLVLIAATDGWYSGTSETRSQALDELARLFARMREDGVRLVGSFDDDLFATGQPLALPYSIYVLVDVDDLDSVVRLIHEVRSSALGAMLRLEARIGRPLFLLDN